MKQLALAFSEARSGDEVRNRAMNTKQSRAEPKQSRARVNRRDGPHRGGRAYPNVDGAERTCPTESNGEEEDARWSSRGEGEGEHAILAARDRLFCAPFLWTAAAVQLHPLVFLLSFFTPAGRGYPSESAHIGFSFSGPTWA